MNTLVTRAMAGPDPGGRGGIAAVIRAYREAGLLEAEHLVLLTTHVDAGVLPKLAAFGGALARVCWLASRQRLALLHVHSASRLSFLRKSLLLAVARLGGAATVFHLHGGQFHNYARDAGPLLRTWIRRTLERSTAVVVLSDHWHREVLNIAPGARVHVLPNPVVLGHLVCLPPPDPARHRLLFVGRVEVQKGLFDLLEALALAARSLPGLQLTVVGEGDIQGARSRARELGVDGSVDFKGWVEPGSLPELLATASAFVLPSHGEGLPVAMLEAMAAARPVIMTPVGSVPEVITPGVEGLLVPIGKPAALAEAIQDLFNDGDRLVAMGATGRDLVAARYDARRIVEQLAGIYRLLGS